MAAHHQTSPATALHGHHGPPAAPLQPNGHAPPGQGPNASTSYDYLQQVNAATWVQIGRLSESLDDSNSAMSAYKRALQFNQWSVEALQAIANILRAEDKYSDAVEFIRTILKVDPNNGESWSALGHCYLMMDELQQAYSAYQSALYNLRDPKEPKLWYGIGILYDRYGSLDHAEEAFSQVMRMAPEFDKANEIYFRLGIIYKQQSKFRESLECFQYIVNNPPSPLNQTDIWFQIGHVYEQQKDYENAKLAYHRVLERDPRHAKVLQQLGWLYHQQSNDYQSQQQAIEYLEKSVSSDGQDAQSWYLLGRCYMSQHKFPKAYEAYQQAVYRDGRNPTFWCSIGVLYYQINQFRDALDAYSRAIRLNPNISEVWYDLGTLYESCNNQTSDALDAYQRAAELDPHNQHIQNRLQLLRSGQPTGLASHNGGLQPQDVPPQHYKPAAAGGPPQSSQWASAPPPGHHQAPAPPAPPPALNPGRDWNQQQPPPPPPPQQQQQQPPHSNEMHGSQAPGAPPAQRSLQQQQQQPAQPPPIHAYDHRDSGRGHGPPPRQPSPRQEQMRAEPHRHTPMSQRQPSPSPRIHSAAPPTYRSSQQQLTPGGPSGQHGPPPPPQQQQQQSQSTPTNRITNPNYTGQVLTPANGPGGTSQGGPLPPYGRPNSPHGPEVRPIIDGRPPSPGYAAHHHQHPYQHHPDPSGPSNIASGAPPPNSAAVAEAAAMRDRQDRPPPPPPTHHSGPGKRPREWDDRDDRSESGISKKMANDQSRARLDDPSSIRQKNLSPSGPGPSPIDRERDGRGAYGGHGSGPGMGPSSHMASPAGDHRRAEELGRINDEYRPSAVAHQPQPLNTTLHQESQQADGGESRVLPPINTSGHGGTVTTPASADSKDRVHKLEPGSDGRHDSNQHQQQQPARDPTPPQQSELVKRPEEPAARKMDVDENYDDDDDDEEEAEKSNGKKAGDKASGVNSNKSSIAAADKRTGGTSSPATGPGQNGVSTGPAPAPPSESTKVEASA